MAQVQGAPYITGVSETSPFKLPPLLTKNINQLVELFLISHGVPLPADYFLLFDNFFNLNSDTRSSCVTVNLKKNGNLCNGTNDLVYLINESTNLNFYGNIRILFLLIRSMEVTEDEAKHFVSSIHDSLSYKLGIGGCTVYYEEPCQKDDVSFYLLTQSRKPGGILLDPFNVVLPANFNFTLPLKLLVHGYGGYDLDSAIKNVSKAYAEIGYNVITVDWSFFSHVPCYPAAFLNTWHVSQCIAILAVSLAALGITPNKFHVLGFSLGAHIAGFASNHLQKSLGVPFGRITGLDPALPFFASFKDEWKLDAGDATFVDVIHTNAGSFGKIEAMGHADFYVNGGSLQPACENFIYVPLCSHFMAGVYFAESVTSMNFVATACNFFDYYFGFCNHSNKAVMGEHCSYKSRGSFFLSTGKKPPFALG